MRYPNALFRRQLKTVLCRSSFDNDKGDRDCTAQYNCRLACDYWLSELVSFFVCLPPTKEEVYAIARVCLSVCLSVCLLATLLKNAYMDLDEILRVDRCRDMQELINFWARSGS